MSMRRWIRRTRTVVGSMSLRSRLGVLALGLAVLVGALWLACRAGIPVEWSALDEIDRADFPVAIERLAAGNISAQIEGSRLCVDKRDLGKARAVLAYEGLGGQNLVAVFEQLSREGDIWATADQNDKRWQAAKMGTLSRLIGMFPPVRTAVVLYELGSPRRIGTEGGEPTASVKVVLKPDAVMDRKLVQAIADLVSGSIAGMKRQNVHIIDNAGRSYRFTDDGLPDSADRAEQLRLAEDLLRSRILQALAYLKTPSVAVRVETDGRESKCLAVTVAVPRTALLASLPEDTRRGSLTDDEFQRLTQPQVDQVRRIVAKLAAVGESDVTLTVYHDAAEGVADAGPVAKAASATWQVSPAAYSAALMLAGIVCGIAAVLRHRRRRDHEDAEALSSQAAESDAEGARAGSSEEALGFLDGVEPAQLLECLRSEHPQTVALVLAQIGSDKSAAVLGGLSPVQQVDVSRRIAALERIDPDVTDQLAATLRQRLGGSAGATGASGMAIITRILHQASPAVEQSVLSALSMEEPTLADTIRRRLMAFEDLSHLPLYRLRAALDGFDSEELAVAMRTASKGLRAKILDSLSAESAQRLREEMEQMGPVRLSDVEAAQQHVTEAVRQAEQGTYASSSEVKERLA
jgi:flagellar motor switch protein FliG/type III secretory pathway lipoprotein EscJ